MRLGTMAQIDFSAQFGGKIAAEIVLPHFRALKTAKQDLLLTGFPLPELAYILRVDGEITQFEFSGVGEINVDEDGEYLSVDIGITVDDRSRIVDVISQSMLLSIDAIMKDKRCIPLSIDVQSLRTCLEQLVRNYRNEAIALMTGENH